MIKLQGSLPKNIIVACSGGVDSMAALDFLRRRHCVIAAYFEHHPDQVSKGAWKVVKDYCEQHHIARETGSIAGKKTKRRSQEEFWRTERYKWLHFLGELYAMPVVTAHHLDDCVETWIWSSMHGEGKVIPYRYKSVVRPFRLNKKANMQMWAELNNVPWLDDPSNTDTRYVRNHIRHELMPHAQKVNPGLHKMVKKKLLREKVKETVNEY